MKNRTSTILLLATLFSLSPMPIFAQLITRKVIDKETGLSIPYAIIYNADKSKAIQSDDDGIFSIRAAPGEIYTISQLGYNSVTISTRQLLSNRTILLEMLPYEFNPIVISADAALKEIYRAIDSTYNRIYSTPFFLRCYKQDQIFSDNQTIVEGKAIIDIKVSRIRSAGKEASTLLFLKGLKTVYNNSFTGDTIRISSGFYSSISPINSFVVGYNKQHEKNIIFTRTHHETENDSTIIITYHPKSSYEYSENFVYKSGRFVINQKDMSILRIDEMADNKSITYLNRLNQAAQRGDYIHELNSSIFLSSNGIPLKIEQKIVYSFIDSPKEHFSWTTLQIYKNSSKEEYNHGRSVTYNPKLSILHQELVALPDFDTQFSRGFK